MYVIVGERVRHETMMWCALVFMAFVAAAQAGPTCVHCDKAREGESKCNTQFLAEGNSLLHCGNNEVCTTDVRCDGKGRVLWIKGCESKNGITAMNTNICNDDNTRCRHHCDGDMCNQFAPADLVPTLACTPPGMFGHIVPSSGKVWWWTFCFDDGVSGHDVCNDNAMAT